VTVHESRPSGTGDIGSIFRHHQALDQAILMPFVTGGFPAPDTTRDVLPRLKEAGAEIVEIGFPFSDPIADGPVIAASMHEALTSGVTPCSIFGACDRAREHYGPDALPALIAMASISLIRATGETRFTNRAASAGFSGLIVPDTDLEDAETLRTACDATGLTLTLLIAPTTTENRARRIAGICTGFVYLLARVGITGESHTVPDLEARIAWLRRLTALPIAVGFGVATAEHVAAVTRHADAVIVGSALVRRMHEERSDPVTAATTFVRTLCSGLRNSRHGSPP